MRRAVLLLVLGLLLVGVAATEAIAQNPHFMRGTSAGTIDDEGNLPVSFRISGLGNDIEEVQITLSADATAVYACRNNGGNFPSDPKKQTISERVEVDQTFPVSNGSARGTLELAPPPSTLDCPAGQSEVLASVEYDNVVISGGGDSVDLGDNFNRTFFRLPRA